MDLFASKPLHAIIEHFDEIITADDGCGVAEVVVFAEGLVVTGVARQGFEAATGTRVEHPHDDRPRDFEAAASNENVIS